MTLCDHKVDIMKLCISALDHDRALMIVNSDLLTLNIQNSVLKVQFMISAAVCVCQHIVSTYCVHILIYRNKYLGQVCHLTLSEQGHGHGQT